MSLFFALAQSSETSTGTYVLTYLSAAESSRPRTVSLLQAYVNASRGEEGARAVNLYRQQSKTGEFLLLESWQDRTSLVRHRAARAATDLTAALANDLVSPEDVRLLMLERLQGDVSNLTPSILQVAHIDFLPPFLKDHDVILEPYLNSTAHEIGAVGAALLREEPPRENHFTILIEWRNSSSLEIHRNSLHTRTYRADLVNRLGGLYDERVYVAIK